MTLDLGSVTVNYRVGQHSGVQQHAAGVIQGRMSVWAASWMQVRRFAVYTAIWIFMVPQQLQQHDALTRRLLLLLVLQEQHERLLHQQQACEREGGDHPAESQGH